MQHEQTRVVHTAATVLMPVDERAARMHAHALGTWPGNTALRMWQPVSPEVTRIPHGLTAVVGLQTKVHPQPLRLTLMRIEDCFHPEYGLPPEVQKQYKKVQRAVNESVVAAAAAAAAPEPSRGESAVAAFVQQCITSAASMHPFSLSWLSLPLAAHLMILA